MSLFLQDADMTLYHGDVLDVLRQLPAESVHMACTSPPFYGLRDYGTGSWEGGDEGCDHLNGPLASPKSGLAGYTGDHVKLATGGMPYGDVCGKCGARRVDQQIGLEATPDLWVARLVEVFREVRRVLRSDGTCWVELGDSFGPGKQLQGSPWLFAFTMQRDGWILRSEVIWSKPNPMPESVTDRPTTSHSRVFMFAKSARYYYDAEAIRAPNSAVTEAAVANGLVRHSQAKVDASRQDGANLAEGQSKTLGYNPAGRNRRSVWEIPTQPYPEAHFATWPEKLVEPMILAGTSEGGVCPECGAPWERVAERTLASFGSPNYKGHGTTIRNDVERAGNFDGATVRTTGWRSNCHSHKLHSPYPVPATVLDPFVGSGTTCYVARRLGRRSIGIDLNREYLELAAKRTQQQSLEFYEPPERLEQHKGLTGGAYSPPGQSPHSNARTKKS